MNPAHDLHPTPARLQAFDTGRLPAAEQQAVERHLERCPQCCGLLDTFPEAPLEAMLRAFVGQPADRGAEDDGGDSPRSRDVPAELAGHPRYRVLEVLGVGGMGVVYKAVHRLMERVVALKILDGRLTGQPAFVERFRREVQTAARLTHPNIVTSYDADQAGDRHFLVMEFVAGTDLERAVARRGPLAVREACDLIRQAALGLQHAHERGMVHCDIKPANLLLTPGGQVKILDFGLAHFRDEGSAAAALLPAGTVLGTPDYLAPEQVRDPGRVDIRADIYSLGCTLYHLLTGSPPFAGGTPLQKLLAQQESAPPPVTTVRADVPAALMAILERMLAKDPARRYPTPAAVAEDLARLADPAAPAPRRRYVPWRGLFAALGMLSVGAAVALAAYLARPAVSPTPRPDEHRPTRFAERLPRPAAEPARPVPPAAAFLTAKELARRESVMRNRAVDWLRANNSGPPEHPLVASVARTLDLARDRSEAFQVILGPGLVKSAKPTLLVGRAGSFAVFALAPEWARPFPVEKRHVRVLTYSRSDDRHRAVPRVILSDSVLASADSLVPGQQVTGTVSYRVLGPWPEKASLRLTCYLGKRRRAVLIPHIRLPRTGQGTLPFVFPPLGNAQELRPGPLVVFVELITQDAGRMLVESNAVATVVRIVPAGAGKP